MKRGTIWIIILSVITGGVSGLGFVPFLNEEGEPMKWHLSPPSPWPHTNVVNQNTRAVRYHIAADAYSETNRLAELESVRAAFDQWEGISGTVLKFEEGPLLEPGVEVNTRDNTNVIFWVKGTTFVNDRDSIGGALALTFRDHLADHTMMEADTVLNGNNTWFTDFNRPLPGGHFVESTVLHEIGHFLGLDHSPAGGATMFVRGLGGINPQAGLSTDEIAATQWLYGDGNTRAARGTLHGTVTSSQGVVFGAVVSVDDAVGNLYSATVTRADGRYSLPGLPAGSYMARVSPLDPSSASSFDWLLKGSGIHPDYRNADTAFRPTLNQPVTVFAGATTTHDFSVTAGEPSFRITRLREPTQNPDSLSMLNAPATLRAGQKGWTVGVLGRNLPSSGAELHITGDGLTVSDPFYEENAFTGMTSVSVTVDVANDATPGLRSFMVRAGDHIAYANGFLVLEGPVPDYNNDGLDDRFQRQFFSRFTLPEAGPQADPDQDGFDNQREYRTQSDPTDPLSQNFLIKSATLTMEGTRVLWESVPGKRYQLLRRPLVAEGSWLKVGNPVVATAEFTEMLDPMATRQIQYYRVEVLP